MSTDPAQINTSSSTLLSRAGLMLTGIILYPLLLLRTACGSILSAIEERLSGIPLHGQLTFGSPKNPLSFVLSAVSVLYFLLRKTHKSLYAQVTLGFRFALYNFLAPVGKGEQRTRLDTFYKRQADIYDATRKGFLRGRDTLMKLSAAHLRELRKPDSGRLVWVDVGGGTGHNVEVMSEFMPISSFDAIYVIDLCQPLLDIAKERIAKNGWPNVHVLCQDAATFTLPENEWPGGFAEAKGSLGFVTFSYSLSMIPTYYSVIDRVSYLLDPKKGLVSVADFYTSGKTSHRSPQERVLDGVDRECNWFTRWFWQIWFEFDHVVLGPQRREYLEYKFGTVTSFSGRNKFILPSIVRIPYYVWLGRSAELDAQDIQMSPKNSVLSPVLSSASLDLTRTDAPLNYLANKSWRLPYRFLPIHEELTTFIYSFTWEDPYEDMKHLDISSEDSLLVITSAGDNALHYAVAGKPKEIHCVDVNPCQGHLFELKLAALTALSYDNFFSMFGSGHLSDFPDILDLKLSPFLSSACYQFWRANTAMFTSSSNFYMHGYSGHALRLARALFTLTGRREDVHRFCTSESLEEQEEIWRERIRPIMLNPFTIFLLKNPLFCWKALGVPRNQRRMLINEGSAYEYIRDTFDPLASSWVLKDGAYHYLLPLLGHYTSSSSPLYLKKEGYDALHADNGRLADRFRIHTDYMSSVLRDLPPSSITRAVIMDHLDWFSKESKEVTEEIYLFSRVLKTGGFILLRSAARHPWYTKDFESAGFDVRCLSVRNPGSKSAMDRVNMYASFWKITKKGIV